MRLIGKKYSDIDYVCGIHSGASDIQMHFYRKCRCLFDRGTARYGNIDADEKADLFQDAFVILWEKIENRSIYVAEGKVVAARRSGVITEIPELSGYFMRIVRNLYLERLREKGSVEAIDEWHECAADEPLWWDKSLELMREQIVRQSFMSLPHRCREILTMFYYKNMSLEEILEKRAENQSYNALKTGKSKCLTLLKARVNDTFRTAGIKL